MSDKPKGQGETLTVDSRKVGMLRRSIDHREAQVGILSAEVGCKKLLEGSATMSFL